MPAVTTSALVPYASRTDVQTMYARLREVVRNVAVYWIAKFQVPAPGPSILASIVGLMPFSQWSYDAQMQISPRGRTSHNSPLISQF
jgi:hypothetical protein